MNSVQFLAALVCIIVSSGTTSATTLQYQCSGCIACPSGWARSGQRCYKFFGAKVTSDVAEASCNEYSNGDGITAHVASINSADEQQFVFNLWRDSVIPHSPDYINVNTANALWLGARKVGSAWTWTDGSTFSYTQWASGQPDGDGTCAHMWTHSAVVPTGSWNDLYCNSRTYRTAYVCELPAGFGTCSALID